MMMGTFGAITGMDSFVTGPRDYLPLAGNGGRASFSVATDVVQQSHGGGTTACVQLCRRWEQQPADDIATAAVFTLSYLGIFALM